MLQNPRKQYFKKGVVSQFNAAQRFNRMRTKNHLFNLARLSSLRTLIGDIPVEPRGESPAAVAEVKKEVREWRQDTREIEGEGEREMREWRQQ